MWHLIGAPGVLVLSASPVSQKVELQNWGNMTCRVSLADIGACLKHFSETNYVALPGWIGRELRGAPMGDALSGAVLRLFKWGRLRVSSPREQQDTADLSGTCVKLARIRSCNVLVLDISFRDDIRLFCAWDASSVLTHEQMATWCAMRFKQRFCTGSMRLEGSDEGIFVGCL